jgi:hypothetical protein
MKKYFLILLFGLYPLKGFCQTPTAEVVLIPPIVPAPPQEKEWDYNFYGFVRTDYIWDTRRSVQVREYNLNLYPLDQSLDINGNDVNDAGASNFLSIVSRLGAKFKGPNVWGAKATGTLEGDFFGNTEASIGLFRLRHAYATLQWTKTEVTVGQTWYPTFIPEVFPGVANFNTGILFNPFGWVSQVRIKQNLTNQLSFTFTAYKEREFTTATAIGGTQNSASFNAVLPTLHGQIQFKNKNWIAGLGFEYKSLQPLTEFNSTATPTTPTIKIKTKEKANSSAIVGYLKYNHEKFNIKAYGISGGDLFSQVMLGGFVGYNNVDVAENYQASKTTSFWVDIASNGKSIAPGLFFGYSKNDGTGKNTLAAGETAKYYMRGVTGTRVVDNVWRASTRVDFKSNKFRVTPELEYTTVTWGDLNTNGNGTADLNKKDFGNFRAMISCAYSF